jgi:hypothetical protein
MARSLGPALRHYWRSAGKLPAGKWLFSRILGLAVPYTGPFAKWMLKGNRSKHWMRTIYSLRASGYKDYFQAGRSVEDIHQNRPAGDLVAEFAQAIRG